MTMASPGPPPATGAWRPGDPVGCRRFVTLFTDAPLGLEFGGTLSPVVVAYETWGELDPTRTQRRPRAARPHRRQPRRRPGRARAPLSGLVGPLDRPRPAHRHQPVLRGLPQRPRRVPGHDGPVVRRRRTGGPTAAAFPAITIRDQVAVEVALADALGIERWAAVVGGSMGGMRALEWAVGHPDRVARRVVVACGAAASAEQIAPLLGPERAIRADPAFRGGDYYDAAPGEGPHRGMGIARRHRPPQLPQRAGAGRPVRPRPQPGEDPLAGGRYAVESYLDHHADKLARRFDAGTYVVLSEAMNHHDVGRGRGGLAAALGGCGAGWRWPGSTATGSTRCASSRSWPSCCRAGRR